MQGFSCLAERFSERTLSIIERKRGRATVNIKLVFSDVTSYTAAHTFQLFGQTSRH